MQTLSQYQIEQSDIRTLYHGLQQSPEQHLSDARHFLRSQLQHTSPHLTDLPANPAHLEAYLLRNNARTASAYRDYLQGRQQGQPRRQFSNRAHALYFLRHVAPTKLVDGAWLYGALHQWHDPRMHDLVRTYLEELGDGEPELNHVLIYKQLLASQDIPPINSLPADHFIQGTLQLALGHLTNEFLPEVIGFNLGYEQLPLHLLITNYELAELGIDPHYFRLHITIDNASTGHAFRAVRAVLDNLPAAPQQQAFYRRVKQGYQLNELGISSTAVMKNFSLDKELQRILEEKAVVARHMHSDYCKIDGRTINEWLNNSAQIPALLDALQRRGWIHRNQDPAKSRFWRLIQSNRAPMFGVFSDYELQLLHDWIAGDWKDEGPIRLAGRRSANIGADPAVAASNREQEVALSRKLQTLPEEKRTRHLIELIAPASHFTPEGLAATRLFVRRMR